MNDPSMLPPQSQGKKSVAWIWVAAIVAGLVVICCVGSLAAIAVPNYLTFNKRSKQSEVKVNLKSAFTAEKALFAEKDTYSESIKEVWFQPERGNRYRYFFSRTGTALTPGGTAGDDMTGVTVDYAKHPSTPPDAALFAAIPPALAASLGVSGTCPDQCSVVVVAVGNVDTDAALDVWSISTETRVIDGESVPAGTPHQHVDDLKN
ncbi:MAG TPA: fimbrial protein [Archangium sp.]